MRILSVHNSYQIRGGEDESRELEENLLREMGHQVDTYEESNNSLKSIKPIPLALRTIWSNQSYRTVRRKLREKQYDLIHVQNFFPLISPSIYYAAKSEGIPVVQTLRNYRLLCPNALFFRDGRVCEDCLGKNIPYPGVVHSCYRENRAATAATTAMLTTHRAIGTWTKMVDKYITLTNFAREKLIEGGIPEEQIMVKPNFVHPDPQPGDGSGGYALYVGRLSVEKGVDTLLDAWKKIDYRVPLKIVGDGPLENLVTEACQKPNQIEWLGRRPMEEVHQLMGEAMFLIFPSKWYETFGRVAVEAFAKGTPVIAAQIGAISELIDSGRTGIHFRPSDASDLAAKVEWALSNRDRLTLMRQEVRREFESKYTAAANYKRLQEIYNLVLQNPVDSDLKLLS